jgi:DnaJ family protein C protein 9
LLTYFTDKAPEDQQDEAKEQFQKLSFAYGILSDERRRSRYDTTGRTEESLHLDDEDDFNWSDFFRSQFAEVISADAIEKFKAEYQRSEEEKLDVVGSYVNNEGDMDALFEEVMLSNPIDDEERFRKIIDEEIEAKRVESYAAYVKESKAKRKKRLNEAKKEAQEAMEMAEELGVKDKLFGGGGSNGAAKKKGKKTEEDLGGLTALIQGRQKSRQENFFADLEAKYGPKSKKGSGGKNKRAARDEPSEEAFERNRKKDKAADAEAGAELEVEIERPRSKRARRA